MNEYVINQKQLINSSQTQNCFHLANKNIFLYMSIGYCVSPAIVALLMRRSCLFNAEPSPILPRSSTDYKPLFHKTTETPGIIFVEYLDGGREKHNGHRESHPLGLRKVESLF